MTSVRFGLKMTRSGSRALFDHLVSAAEQRDREGEAERLCGLHINDQLDFRGQLHREVGRLVPLENPAGVDADRTEQLRSKYPRQGRGL